MQPMFQKRNGDQIWIMGEMEIYITHLSYITGEIVKCVWGCSTEGTQERTTDRKLSGSRATAWVWILLTMCRRLTDMVMFVYFFDVVCLYHVS